MKKQIVLAVSMVFLVLAVCSAAAAADVSDNGTQIQAQNQTVSQINYNSTNMNSVQVSETNSSQTSTTNTNSVQTNTTEQPSKVIISGQVTKCSTGEPFPGVTVTAQKDGVPIASTTTKEDGTYNLEFLSDDGVFNVTASYPGHESSTKEVNVNPNSNGTLQGSADFQLGVAETYVDDDWVGKSPGDIVFFPGDPNPHVIGIDAFATISDGVNNANPGGTVHIADGTYTGPANRGICINKDLNIVGQSQAGTVIDGQTINRIFTIDPGVTVTLQNLTFTNGYAAIGDGGAILNSGDLTVNECTFADNNAGFDGGAIWNNGDLTVNDSTFTTNHTLLDDGGAIWNSGGTSATPVTISNCTFTGNSADDAAGAIYNTGTLNVTDNSTFTSNGANFGDGGAIWNNGDLTVNDSTFTTNHADDNGGAIWNDGPMNVTGSNFENNSVLFDGGAIFNSGGDATNRKFNFNRIVGNSPANSEVHSEGGTLDARFNWWGSNTSPAGKISTAFGGVVLFDPWLVLTITANPTTIINGDTSQVTADLLHDSNGVFHDPAFGHVPDGIPITLTTDWGSFTNPGITHSITLGTVNGSVTATFFANEGPTPQPPLNPVEITATADDQNVSMFITILPPPPQRQTQNQTQTQTSINTNTNNLTNNNFNALSNVNTFNPVISLVNLNGV